MSDNSRDVRTKVIEQRKAKVIDRYGLLVERDHWIWILGLYRDAGNQKGMRKAFDHINDLDRRIKEL